MTANRPRDSAQPEPERPRSAYQNLKSQNQFLVQLVNIYERMTSMVVQGADLEAVTELFAALVNRSVTVLDPSLQPLAAYAPEDLRDGSTGAPISSFVLEVVNPLLRRVLPTLAEGKRPLRVPLLAFDKALPTDSCVLAPIIGGGDEVLGYLMLLGGGDAGDEEIDMLAAQHVATTYALVLMRQQIAADLTNKLRSDLIEGLLSGQLGSPQEARERALYLGYDTSIPHRVLVMGMNGVATAAGDMLDESPAVLALRRRALDALTEFIAARFPAAIAVARSGELVVVAPNPHGEEGTGPRPDDLARACVQRVGQLFPGITLTVGVGSECGDPTELARSYGHARRTLAAARRFGRIGRITAIEDLGIFRLLYQISDPQELGAFAEGIVGPLAAHDRLHDSDLLKTLSAYLRHKGSVHATARELFLHPNTVSYRIKRIAEIGGLDLDDHETRLSVQIALKILEGLDVGD